MLKSPDVRTSCLSAALLAAAFFVAACQPGSPGPATKDVVYRFIEEPPTTVYSPSYPSATSQSLISKDLESHFVWSLETPANLRPWRPGTIFGLPDDIDEMARRLDSRMLIREVDIDAAGVREIQLRARGVTHGFVLWAESERPFSWRRRQKMRTSKDGTLSFAVDRHSEWRGRIGRLMLLLARDPGQRPNESIEIDEMRGMQRAINIDAALSQAHKVRLGDEVREALLALPDHLLERRLEIPRGAELHFAYALDSRIHAPVRFRVSATEPRLGTRQLFEEVVFPDEELPPDEELAPEEETDPEPEAEDGSEDDEITGSAWRQARIDLSELGGHEVELRLETRVAGDGDPGDGFALWGHPEIVKPRRGPPPPNVVLIVIDTLRADRLSLYGNPRPTSPNIDEWARGSGAVFKTAVASTSFTLSSHFSIFTGIDAHRHGVTSAPAASRNATDSMTMLAEILRAQGYTTAAFTGGGWVHPRFGFDQGFDVYRFHQKSWTEGELRQNLHQALTWLEQPRRPFFLFFHTYTVHGPFRARQPFFSQFSELSPDLKLELRANDSELTDERHFVLSRDEDQGGEIPLPPELSSLPFDQYDSGVAYMDAELSRLLARLEEPDLKGRTIVILTSDHGERLGEGGIAGHGQLHDTSLLIPLIIAAPGGVGAGASIEEQARSVDVLPTILELASLETPPGIDGVSLVPAMRGRNAELPDEAWSYSRSRGLSVRLRDRVKYTFQNLAWSPEYGDEELYDLYRDPGENDNLAPSPESNRLRQRVREVVEHEVPGLRIRFENAGTMPLSGSLRSGSFDRWAIKSVDLPCACVTFHRKGEIGFEIPAGEEYTLIVEPVQDPRLRLSIDPSGEKRPFHTVFDMAAAETIEATYWDGAKWRRGTPPPEPRTGVSAWWQGKQLGAGEEEDHDENLRRQLTALGYLD